MKNILSRTNIEVLEQFAWSNALLALDFDGTLAPIVDDPDAAFMRPTTRRLLQEAARVFPAVVISGRARSDALDRLRGVGLSEVIGNHGLEPSRGGAARLVAEVRRWMPLLEERLAAFKGVWIEDKKFSIAVHYRQSREKKAARAAIIEAASAIGELRVVGGAQVVNLLPEGAPHKGMALERERERLQCDTAIYVGDDETDEDVFALDRPGRLLTIRVGASRASQASFYVPRQAAIDHLLRALVDLRKRVVLRRQAAR